MPPQDDRNLHGLTGRHWNLRSFSVPVALQKVPTMLTAEECRMLAWIAEVWPTQNGAVCDLGCFLGGSTAHLAYGLSRSRSKGTPVDSFDFFTIAEDHKQIWLYDRGHPTLVGKDMHHLFEEFVAPFGKARSHPGNIDEATWDGGPIEILFVDIMKGWDTTLHVMREFYPHLIPGSVVIHQDFQHFQHPWIVATTEAFFPHLEMVSWTEENSAVFLCKEKIDRQVIEDVISRVANIDNVYALIRSASNRMPYGRQREAVWQHLQALSKNPSARYAWNLSSP